MTSVTEECFPGIVASELFLCECGRSYKYKWNLNAHKKNECGKEAQFLCPHCPYKSKVKSNLKAHIASQHIAALNTWLRCSNVSL